jgi:hypothetical protein
MTDAKPRESVVYFVEALELDRVKIGWTTNLEERLHDLQTGCPAPVELCFTLPGGRPEEASLHRRFAHARVHGEWFRLSEIEAAMRELEAVGSIPFEQPRCPDCLKPKAPGSGRRFRLEAIGAGVAAPAR